MWARLGLSAGQLADLLDHLDEDPDDCEVLANPGPGRLAVTPPHSRRNRASSSANTPNTAIPAASASSSACP
ncbi:hypothetical protein SAMN04489727_7811 [Amycolatopsis tolypomycina]|uniref:Uncharacterized protein n=1 Tax=Amycolatopsis tolypomycina TaxID=208445 RepID=A0A1H5AIU1_9PSEU|nr:hypothetical protein SAMN04489727_7811 [Amycolatopsis tolypomycina]